jgi:hypothetical protein
LNKWVVLFFFIKSSCFAQVEFSEMKMFEEFFGKIRFEDIPYYKLGIEKPSITIDQAKDTIIEVYNDETFDLKYVNEKEYFKGQWRQFDLSQRNIKKRDSQQNGFHLIITNLEQRETKDLKL